MVEEVRAMTFAIDRTTEEGARVAARLERELIGWLTTVDGRGAPIPTPVWFFWDASGPDDAASGSLLIYSQPDTLKLKNIARNPRVSLNLEGNSLGGNIVVVTGTAAVDGSAPAAIDLPLYIDKYRDGIREIQMTPETFSAEYRVPIRITPDKLRAFYVGGVQSEAGR